MFFKDKRKWIPFGILIVFVIGTAVLVRSEIQSASVQKRQKEAQTPLSFFYENLSVNFEKLNYAKQLSYTDPYLDRDLTLFEQVSLRLLAEYSAIEAIAYFEGDTLTAVYPKEEYGKRASGVFLQLYSGKSDKRRRDRGTGAAGSQPKGRISFSLSHDCGK